MISVITINYNNKEGLKKTLDSVASQKEVSFQYVVVDGNSTDGSVALLEQYKAHISTLIVEPDSGIYQAMNKGIKAAKGTYLLFLNSGDSLHTETVLKQVNSQLSGNKDLYYGNLLMISDYKGKPFIYPKKLTFSWVFKNSLPHPATFIKRDLFKDNLYNESLKLVADWQFFMQVLFKRGASYQHLDLFVSKFDTTGFSNNPDYKSIMKKERDWVMEHDFGAFKADMELLNQQSTLLQEPGVKSYLDSNLSKTGRRIHLKFLKFLGLLFKKDLNSN